MSESGSQINPRPQVRSGPIRVLSLLGAGSEPARSLFGICPELGLGHHPQLVFLVGPPGWGLSRASRSHSPGSRFLAGGFLWISGKTEDRSLQAGAGQEVLVAHLAQRTGIGFPKAGSKLFSGNFLQNAKATGRLGPLSLDLSSPIHEDGVCKRGSFTVHGGRGSPAPHLPALALQVCL